MVYSISINYSENHVICTVSDSVLRVTFNKKYCLIEHRNIIVKSSS